MSKDSYYIPKNKLCVSDGGDGKYCDFLIKPHKLRCAIINKNLKIDKHGWPVKIQSCYNVTK